MNRTSLRSILAAGCIAVLTLGLAGCGGGGDDEKALTKAQFIQKADAICEKANDEATDIGANLSDSSSESDIEDAVSKLADHYDDEIEDLKALTPPESAEDDVDDLLDSLTAGVKKIRELGAELLQQTENPLADASEKAKAFGLETCGSGS